MKGIVEENEGDEEEERDWEREENKEETKSKMVQNTIQTYRHKEKTWEQIKIEKRTCTWRSNRAKEQR